jgi:hypothetical protein
MLFRRSREQRALATLGIGKTWRTLNAAFAAERVYTAG